MKNHKHTYKLELLHLRYHHNRTLYNYLRFYREDAGKLLIAFLFFLIKASPVWVIPIVTANIINTIEKPDGRTIQMILQQAAIGTVFILQNIPMHILYFRYLSLANRSVEMKLRSSLCLRLQHLSISYHKNNKMGKIQTKILRDVENVESFTRLMVDSIPGTLVTLVVALSVTAMRAPKFLFFFLVMIPIAVLIFRLAKRKMSEYNRDFRVSMENMSGKVIEMLRMISVTRAHNVENAEILSVNHQLEQVRTSGLRLDMLNSIFGSVNWVTFMMFNLITLCAASYMNYKKIIHIGIGDIVLLTTYFNTISNGIMYLTGIIPQVSKGLESVKSITEILESPDIEENEGKPELKSLKGSFEFQHVFFHYDHEPQPALSDFTLSVKPGETIALVGPSGSGKSTVMQLLIGFIRPTQGKIYVDGYDMNQLDLRSYRRFISVVSQESILFDGTIRENITYGAPPDVTEQQIQQAVECANLKDFVDSLPEGLNTLCKENGARLSGGQKQRMAIARALLRNPDVLLLDEATSALDVESEALIQDALDRLIKGRTTFIVAHRLSTIRDADRIVVLSGGRIQEMGSHDELMEQKGIYYRMNLLQSKHISHAEAARISRQFEKKSSSASVSQQNDSNLQETCI